MPSFSLRTFVPLFLLFLSMWDASAAERAAVQRIGNTAVFAATPKGFVKATPYPGLVNYRLKASIVVTELPSQSFLPTLADYTSAETLTQSFDDRNITFDTIEMIRADNGRQIKVGRGKQVDKKRVFDKWIAIYPGQVTAVVTFHVLERTKLDPEIVRTFFASVTVGAAPSSAEVLASLTYDLQIEPPFQMGASVDTAAVLLVGGTDLLNSQNDQATILIFRGPGMLKGTLDVAAETALRGTPNFRDAKILTRRNVTFAGFRAVELTGQSMSNGTDIVFTQRFARGPGGLPLRMVVYGPEDALQKVAPQVERIFSSIRLRRI